MKRNTLFLLLFICQSIVVSAQNSYCAERFYDDEHKNEISGYVMVGNNVITDVFGGLSVSYQRHLTPRWHVGGDAQMQFSKQLFSVDVQGGYRLPVKYGNIYFDGKLLYNRYNKWGFNEYIANLSATWESAYVDIRIGESFIRYTTQNKVANERYGVNEPLTLTFGIGANIRHRSNPWNIGLFFRNYDDYYYENWNINWGIRWYARIKEQWNLFGEFNIRPAGSMSQLATKYEGSVKLGLKYKW